MEVQFNKNSADASIVTGPITIFGMVSGFLLSGYIISKYKPGPRKLFFWNVLVGLGYMLGQVIYIFLSCDNNYINNFTGTLNLTAQCNTNCSCDGVAYSPVCYEPTSTTFFSPCHAACNRWDDAGKFYDNCACATESHFTKLPLNYSTILLSTELYKTQDRTSPFPTELSSSSILSTSVPSVVSTSEYYPVSFISTESTVVTENVTENQNETVLFKTIINTTDSTSVDELVIYPQNSTTDTTTDSHNDVTEVNDQQNKDDDTTTTTNDYNSENDYNITEEKISRQERSLEDDKNFLLRMVPGSCLDGCAKGFYMFTIISFVINWFGATGRIGNILLNFR